MKRLTFFLLLLAGWSHGQSPGRLPIDTTSRPLLRPDLRIGPEGRVWVVPTSGNKTALPTYAETQAASALASGALPTVSTIASLSASSASVVNYDGSLWKKQAGSPAIDNVLYVYAGIGFYYERQHNNTLDAKWLTTAGYSGDAAPVIQKLLNAPGKVSLIGTFTLNAPLYMQADNLEITGPGTLYAGTALAGGTLINANAKTGVAVTGIRFLRATGNTSDPMSFVPQSCSNVTYANNTCVGVLGIQTYRPTYSTATSASLCYNVTVDRNSVTGVGTGPYGGAYTLNYVIGAKVTNNAATDCVHGIIVWGGDANPANGENNTAGTATKWAKNVTISTNTVSHADRQTNNGGGIWTSMAENITANGNVIDECGDVDLDFEGTTGVTAGNNVLSNAKNAAISTFHGSKDITLANTTIRQGSTYGNGFHGYGSMKSTNIKILGGSMVSLSTTKEPIFADDNMVDGFQIGGGLSINSPARAMTLQRTNNVTITGALSITTSALNADSRNYAIYVQGGDNVNIGPGVTFTYSGTATAGAVFLSDGGSGNLTNARIESIKAPGFSLGVKNDQFGGGTGTRMFDNQIEAISVVSGSPIGNGNRNAAGTLIDGTPDGTLYVQGTTAQSRSVYIGSGAIGGMNLASGDYSIGTAVTGMPTSSTNYTLHVTHHEDSSGPGGGTWATWVAIPLVTTNHMYIGGRNGDGSQKSWVTVL